VEGFREDTKLVDARANSVRTEFGLPPPGVTLEKLASATGGSYQFDDSGGNQRLGLLMAGIIDRMRKEPTSSLR